jgi:NADPH:quinone reductase-like Zn-dependent oxidoreductase
VPVWACQKLLNEEDINVMCTLPVVYGTAIYALYMKANLQPGESILIHSGAGGVGIAAIQLAKLVGAEIFTTVSTSEKRDYLVEEFGLKSENIFTSRDTSFATALMQATNGQGVDVVLNSLTGDLLHASWRCLGQFGRFIEIGKRDLTDSGRLEMDQFLKNAMFSAFDLSMLYASSNPVHHKLWANLMQQVLELYRQTKISEFPLEVFDIQELPSALRRFGLRSRIGKVWPTKFDLKIGLTSADHSKYGAS